MVVVIGAGGHGRDIAHFSGWGLFDEYIDFMRPGAPGGRHYVAGVNDPVVRETMSARLERDGWIAHNDGVVVWPGAHIGPAVDLGRHVHVNAGAFLTRCTVGEFTTVAPNATILGDVTIGARCFIGANATIRNLLSVCDDVTVGCGAVVVKDIDEPGTYAGNPARPL